jgi:hypothetical protein
VRDPAPGRLVTLPARSVWGDEAQVFTPWLADHIDLLAEALQLGDLEVRGIRRAFASRVKALTFDARGPEDFEDMPG